MPYPAPLGIKEIEMTRKTEAPPTPPAFDAQGLWDMSGRSFEMAERACRAWMGGAMQIQNEALDFMRASAGRNVTAASEIAHCTNAAEAFGLQSRYAQENVAEWLDEGRKMAEMMGALWQENLAMFGPPATAPDRTP